MQAQRLLATALLALAALPAIVLAGKQTICHVPPGSPDNAHTISVSDAAVSTHLTQHDGDHPMSAGSTCGGAAAAVPPNNDTSAAVEICATSGNATGRRIDVSGLGGVTVSAKVCGS